MFDYFLMDGWWYVVKVRDRRHIVYLKTKSKAEASQFFARLNGVGMSRYESLQARGMQGMGMSGLAGQLGLSGNRRLVGALWDCYH